MSSNYGYSELLTLPRFAELLHAGELTRLNLNKMILIRQAALFISKQ